MTRVILLLPAHILIGSKERISPTNTISFRSSHIDRLVYSQETIILTAASLGPLDKPSSCLSDLIELQTGHSKILDPRHLLMTCQEIFVL